MYLLTEGGGEAEGGGGGGKCLNKYTNDIMIQ